MKTTTTTTWLLLLALLGAVGGAAHGAILCVGADGHRELERALEVCGVSHENTEGPTETPTMTSSSACCGACTDLEISVQAVKRTRTSRGDSTGTSTVSALSAVADAAALRASSVARQLALPCSGQGTIGTLRTVILLL